MIVERKQIKPEGVSPETTPAPAEADGSSIFDLGSSAGSNIALEKDAMIAEAFASVRERGNRLKRPSS